MLRERRSISELEELLAERVPLLRKGEIGPAHLHRTKRTLDQGTDGLSPQRRGEVRFTLPPRRHNAPDSSESWPRILDALDTLLRDWSSTGS